MQSQHQSNLFIIQYEQLHICSCTQAATIIMVKRNLAEVALAYAAWCKLYSKTVPDTVAHCRYDI